MFCSYQLSDGSNDMRNISTIFKSDLRRLSRSFWAMVIIAACMLLPAMYAWVNIYANWNPYGNTSGVKIAVVSNDKTTLRTMALYIMLGTM